jgi:hypothetical protein
MHTIVAEIYRLSGKNHRIVAQIQVGFPGFRSDALLRMRTSFVPKVPLAYFPQGPATSSLGSFLLKLAAFPV